MRTDDRREECHRNDHGRQVTDFRDSGASMSPVPWSKHHNNRTRIH